MITGRGRFTRRSGRISATASRTSPIFTNCSTSLFWAASPLALAATSSSMALARCCAMSFPSSLHESRSTYLTNTTSVTARPSRPPASPRLPPEPPMNPYRHLVTEIARLVREGKQYPLGGFPTPVRAPLAEDAPRALVFSPHPDDECIIGGFALRLLREAGVRVVNVAVTQGSSKDRQAARWTELAAACEYLGFDLLETVPGGLERIHVRTRQHDAASWEASVAVIAGILSREQPRIVFFPHDADWNSTHIGTHHLVVDALARQPGGFSCTAVETEF